MRVPCIVCPGQLQPHRRPALGLEGCSLSPKLAGTQLSADGRPQHDTLRPLTQPMRVVAIQLWHTTQLPCGVVLLNGASTTSCMGASTTPRPGLLPACWQVVKTCAQATHAMLLLLPNTIVVCCFACKRGRARPKRLHMSPSVVLHTLSYANPARPLGEHCGMPTHGSSPFTAASGLSLSSGSFASST